MSERKSVFLLIAVMTVNCLVIAGTTITILYKTSVEEARARLIETARSQARLIESTAQFNAVHSKEYPGGPNSATLSQIIHAHDHDVAVGKTEFTLSKKEGENMVFLLRHRHDVHSKPDPVPFESKLAEPMRRALSGQSGSVIGLDYHGQTVLAAYEPLKELNLGIVAKMDMSDVRAPFLRAGLIVVFLTVLVVSSGAGFFIRLTNPMVRQLEKRALELKKLNVDMKVEINERRQAEKALRKAYGELDLKVEERTAVLMETNETLMREIEERKKVEESLRESEQKYRLLVRTLPAVVYKGYTDWSVEFFDDKIEALTGHDPDEFNSGSFKWSDIIVNEDLESVRESFIHALKSEKAYILEYRIRELSGEIKWIQDRGHIVCDSRGAVEYISGVFFDITDRKKQEEKLKRSEELLQTVFDGIPDPLVLLDKSLKVGIINQAAMRYYRIENTENINGICCYEALMGKSAPCEGCQVPAAVASGKSGSFERKGTMDPNNLEQVNIYHFYEKGHDSGGALMRIQDITESRLMERKMIHNEKLASLGLTVSCITHEVANPISAITFSAPILEDYINAMIYIVDDYAKNRENFELFQMPYSQFRTDVSKITKNILHASKRVNTTLSDLRKLYGYKREQKKQWVDIKQLVEKTIAVEELEIGQYVNFFDKNIPENLPKIHTDPGAVEQILTNLLINASHAADKEDSRIKLDVTLGDTWKDHLIIEISDNGCGMDPETLSKIFNPFFTTKGPGQGTGLGLYVCQDLIKDLGGRIEVQSELGKGSVFRVVIPDIERRSVKRV